MSDEPQTWTDKQLAELIGAPVLPKHQIAYSADYRTFHREGPDRWIEHMS